MAPGKKEGLTKPPRWNRFFVWLAILTPLSILTIDWLLIHVVLLVVLGPSLFGAASVKRVAYLAPFTYAFLLALLIGLAGFKFWQASGVADLLPAILGQHIDR